MKHRDIGTHVIFILINFNYYIYYLYIIVNKIHLIILPLFLICMNFH